MSSKLFSFACIAHGTRLSAAIIDSG